MKIPVLPSERTDVVERSLDSSVLWAAPYPSDSLSESGERVNHFTALQASAVYACVRLLSETVAVMPWRVWRSPEERGRTVAATSPADRLLGRRPNRYQTPYAFKSWLMQSLALRGNAYCLILRDSRARPVELIPIDAGQVDVLVDSTREVYYRVRSIDRTTSDEWCRVWPAVDVLHVRAFSIDGYVGLTPIGVSRRAVGLSLAQENFGARQYKNQAKPSGWIEYPGKLQDTQYTRMRDSFERTYAGADNAGKVAILEDGSKFNPLSMTAEDVQWIASRKFQATEIARLFRVPPHMIGELERATNANVESMGQEFLTYSIVPWIVNLEQEADAKLLAVSEAGTHGSKFDPSALLRADSKTRTANHATARQWGWKSVNDVRHDEGLPPIPDGDRYLEPVNMAKAGQNPNDDAGDGKDPKEGE